MAVKTDNKKRLDDLATRIAKARSQGALFHPTNPVDNWFCPECSVFGKGEVTCWSCGTKDIEYQYVPRFGGGAQSVQCEENVV